MPDLTPHPSASPIVSTESATLPDYRQLVKFLIQPFLEQTEKLSVDCETNARTGRVIVRVAFEAEDKGRIFGRGGRNIQAIRTVLQAAAMVAGQTAYLDIYDGGGADFSDSAAPRQSSSRRRSSPRPSSRPRPKEG
jgi:predicted RNA-binding protein YlqC (UPF0109 family)